ncbi:inositol 2-dehydrogenase [Alicyclobacillus shizuokensis]|uniref:inositol 2-dehydrogenase n=1 Tax=Alicyclobacillus shizuokensis TaxID=392014 RepID=UPI000836292C|nr:inositol 2-dehydrogenase [Alicyclobacillus shizuokensis]MCL6626393.1 inositol 2-dehydrogenase [Alicyclobacillus shizuokensis]
MREISVGIIGAGRIGKLHAENIRRFEGVRIKAVSDIYVDAIRTWAKDIGIQDVTDDYQDILSDSEIEAILICAPTDLHTQIIEEAAQVGKHVFCEKPVSMELEKTCRAVDTAQANGICLQIGFNRRFDHNFKRLRRAVTEGALGQSHILKITSRDPHPPSADYIKTSGGIFLDMAIHDFDLARYIVGGEVEEVYAQGEVLIDDTFREVGDVDTAVTVLKFDNGAIGVIDNSRKAVYGYDQRVEVFGSQGCMVVDNDYQNTAQFWTEGGVYRDAPKSFFLDRYHEAYTEEVKSFIECIRNGKLPLVTGHDGFQAECIAHAAMRSFKEKRPIKVRDVYEGIGGETWNCSR